MVRGYFGDQLKGGVHPILGLFLWGGVRALLERMGEAGGGVRGEPPPPPAEMQHTHKELQKHIKLTHSAYTFVITSEDRQG